MEILGNMVLNPSASIEKPVVTRLPSDGSASGFWRSAEELIPWVVWLAMTGGLAGFVARFGYDLPFWDEWALIPLLTGEEPVSLAELWAPLNEHRILLARVLMMVLAAFTGGDWRAGMAVSVSALSAAAVVALCAARTARGGRTRWTDAAFPLLLLHWGQAENLLWNIQMIVTVPVLLSVAVVAVLIRPSLSVRSAAGASAGLLLLGLCGGFGLIHLPGLVAVVGLRGLVLIWRGDRAVGEQRAPMVGSVLLAGAGLATVLVGLYFSSRVPPAVELPPPTPGRAVLVAAEFLLTGWGHGAFLWEPSRLTAAAVTVGLGLLATGLCARTAWADAERRWSALAVLAGLVGLFQGAAMVAWGRGAAGENAGLMVRYVTLAAPLVPMILLALALTDSPAGRGLAAVLALASAALLVPNTRAGLSYARAWESVRQPASQDLQAGWPSAAWVTRHAAGLTPHPQHAVDRLEMMRRARFGPFRHLDEPDRVAEPLMVGDFARLPAEPRMLACVELYGQQTVVQPLPTGPAGLPLAAVDVTLVTLGHRLRERDRIGWQIRTRPTAKWPSGQVLRTGELATVSVQDWQPARLRLSPPLSPSEAAGPWELVLLGGPDTPRQHGLAVLIWEAPGSVGVADSARAEPSPDAVHSGGHPTQPGVGVLHGFVIWGRLP